MSNIFEDKTQMPEKAATVAESDSYGLSSPGYQAPAPPPPPEPIRVVMTPAEGRAEYRASYPRWAGMDVQNVTRPRRGSNY